VRFEKFAPAVVIAVLFSASPVFSQWMDEIQTESDWEGEYNDGYYDYNTYQIYRELGEGAGIDDTADFIAGVLGNPLSEIESPWPAPNIQDLDTIISPQLPQVYFRSGQKIFENDNNGYTAISSNSGNISLSYKGRNESNSWNTDRRYISFDDDKSKITLGNYSPDIGLGLGIGRYDYRPLVYQSTALGGEDFLFPDNSYYNGANIIYGDHLNLLYSRKKYNNANKNFAGGSFSCNLNDIKLGLTAGSTILSSSTGHRTMGAGSIFLSHKTIGLKTELGYAESGIGFCLQYRREGFDIRLWHYDKSFLNLQSSAPAYSDYISYSDENLKLSFREPQAGENGAYLARRIALNKIGLFLSTEIWKRSPADEVALDNVVLARYLIREYLDVFSKYAQRFGSSNGRTLFEGGMNFHRRFTIGVLTSIWIEGGHVINSKSLNHIYCSMPIHSRIVIAGRLRWKMNGDFDYFVEEKTMIAAKLWMKLTYRWADSYHDHLGPFYIVLESSL
jgi:hypothetical protein